MKKLILTVLLITFAITCVFSQNGTIRELTGEVELKHSGASVFVSASAGDTVSANTIVSTGFRSTAVIAIGSSLITVRPLTRLTLAEIQRTENAESVNLNLQAGRIRVDVNPPAGSTANLTVQSPSSTASVRGTSFEMDVNSIRTIEGRIVYSGNTGPAVIVIAGNESRISTGGTPANPPEVTASSIIPAPPAGTPPAVTITPPPATDGSFNLELIWN